MAAGKYGEPHHWKDQVLQDSKSNNITEKRGGIVEAIPGRYSIAYFSALDPATVVEF